MELETITPMYCGTVAGGFELLPGLLVHVPPHVGVVVPSSNPLKAFGAAPLVIGLFCDHCAPQKVTVAPPVRLARLPTTNSPPAGNWNAVQASPIPSWLVSR